MKKLAVQQIEVIWCVQIWYSWCSLQIVWCVMSEKCLKLKVFAKI